MTCPKYLAGITLKLRKFFGKGILFQQQGINMHKVNTSARKKITSGDSKKYNKKDGSTSIYIYIQRCIAIPSYIIRKILIYISGFTSRCGRCLYHYIYGYKKDSRYNRIAFVFVTRLVRRHLPLFLAILFITPAAITLGIFIYSRLYKPPIYATNFTGAIRVSKQSTTLSTAGDWFKSMAYSADGVNGDADYFNPIHPGNSTSDAAGGAGTMAAGYATLPTTTANNYDSVGAQFIPFKPNADGNLYGVTLALLSTATSVVNRNIVVEVLRFPAAHYSGTPPSGSWDANTYVSCSALNTCTYPADTVIERKTVMRWDQTIANNELLGPAHYGVHYMEFRFDPPLAVVAGGGLGDNYGFRVYYNSLTTLPSWPRNGTSKPNVNAINFGLGIIDVDVTDSATVTVPLANTGNTTSSAGVMVAANSAIVSGGATVARTQNEHWRGTYSAANGNWTIATRASGADSWADQTAKLTTVTTGGTGTSWVNDGVTSTVLSAPATVSTRLCVASVAGFAANQIIDIWDSQTASIQRTIASINETDANCSNGPSIIVTAALAATDAYTTTKNATVARANWKMRIIQGGEEAMTQYLSTTKFCVGNAAAFSVPGATYNNVILWDNDTIQAVNRITAIGVDDAACTTNPGDDSITVFSSIANYSVAQSAHVAEISTNFSNQGTPSDGAVFRFTSINMSQNPTAAGTIYLYYSRVIAPATSACPSTACNNYPWISNLRFPFFVSYGDAETSAPVDGDFVIVGTGATDPDNGDSINLSSDLLLATISPHTVTIDKNFDMPLIYTGSTGDTTTTNCEPSSGVGAIGNGTTCPASASYGGLHNGFVSMLIGTRAKLSVSNTANQHYRLVAPGKVLLSSGAQLELGSSSAALPRTSTVDLYLDSSGPTVSTALTADSTTNTYVDVASTTGFYIGDTVMIKDSNSIPIVRIIAAVTSSTRLTFTAAMVAGYTIPSATVSRGSQTDIPTGADRRAMVVNAAKMVSSTTYYGANSNLSAYGSDSFRTSSADLAVDIDGNIDTGYLAGEQAMAGNTWLDVATVSGTLAGNWSTLDSISVAQGTNQAVNNWDSSVGMGANDNANAFPIWVGGTAGGSTGSLGYNGNPNYNTEIAEIGTIPLTNIYNVDYNGGGSAQFSSNYATTTAWTIFNDNANSEVNDAVYFGDQGTTPVYALEFNIGAAISASVTRVWEYWNGSSWTEFTPSTAWKYLVRGNNTVGGYSDICVPFNASPTYPTATVQLTDTNTYFTAGQWVKIKDDDSPTVIRRLSSVTAGAPANMVFTEVVPSGYTTGANAKVCVSNGGQWMPMDASSVFTQTGRTLISWNSQDIPNAAKTTVNSISAYWVRNRISAFTSWTTSPTNQTTTVGMQGVETSNSQPLTVFNSVSEARLSNLSTGNSFDPNETWVLRYNDNSTAVSTLKTTRWYESQTTSWGTAHRWLSPNPDGVTSAYYEKNTSEANWHTLNGSFGWTDYSVYAKVYFNAAADSTRKAGIFLRQDADDYGYAFYVIPNTTPASSSLRWYSIAAGAETAIGTVTTTTANAFQWYCIRAEVNGTTLQAKFWSPVSEDANCNGDANEPAFWNESEISQSTYTTGRFGLACDAAYCRFDDVTVKNTASTETWFSDNFNNTGCWKTIGSIHGSQGCAYNSVPFTSSYINFTIKHKGGVQAGETGTNAVIGPLNAPEEGDEIYLSPQMRGSNVGLDETTGITTSNTYSKYENWDLVYDSAGGHWDVTGSQYGSAGTTTSGSTYTSPGGEISLKVKGGTPAAPKFGTRAAYFQNSIQRSGANFTGLNNHNSAILIQPYWTVSGSSNLYNIEGSSGSPLQKGTVDFWFKPNFTGSPDYVQYLFDYAANSLTDRIYIRIMPSGVIEAGVGPAWGKTTNGILSTSFSAVAGQWYHMRLVWEDSDSGQLNMKRAWLNGAVFTTNQGTAVGARAASAGIIRLGNSYQYNAGFDGAIDEFAIFDDSVDTSTNDDWSGFTPASSAYTSGQTLGTGNNVGNNIFLTHFDTAMDPKKGFVWADYFVGQPEMVFTNGVDILTGDRIRVVTYPFRTRIWMDNTGSQYTPSARVKYSEGYAQGSEVGWMPAFQYHHRAKSVSTANPINSPVLNLRRQIRIWSDEDVAPAEGTAPANQAFGLQLFFPRAVDVNNIEMQQLFYGLYLYGNPYKTAAPYASQYIRNSAFNNVRSYPVYIYAKTLGTDTIDNNVVCSLDYAFSGFREDNSSNITISNNKMMDYARNSAAYSLIYLSGGRQFTISGNTLLNSSYPLYMAAGTAKVTVANNGFWRYIRAIQFLGNSFIALTGNTFDGGISSESTNGYFGTALYITPGSSNVEVTDDGSIYGKSIPNEVDMYLPPDTTSWLAGSLFRYIGENVTASNPYHYLGLSSQDNFGNEYIATAIPGVDARLSLGKNIVNYGNYGVMRTTGAGLADTLVKTSGGYAWRMESTSETDALEYTARVVGVAGEPLAATGYLRLNANYGTANLPTVTLSGLGMTGANLTWTAEATADTWQQFVVSGTPTESALATLTISVKSEPVAADSGTAENVDDAQAIYLPTLIEDTDKNWVWNQWAGYKMRDDQNFIFDIIGNTATRLFLKGTRIPFGNTLPTQPYGATYEIFSPPYVYLDDVSVLSGTVDTGTLDFHSSGQPVSPWLATGLTASSIWGTQYSSYSDITGSFGQLIQDALIARYGDVSDVSPTTTEFDTNLTVTTDDYYNDGVIIFTEGTNEGVIRRISDYTGANKTITVDPALTSAPTDGDRFAILAATSASTGNGGATAAEIWSYTLRQLTTADLDDGGTGSLATTSDIAALNNISAADIWEYATKTITGVTTDGVQDIWEVACSILNTSGSVGKQVCDNLDTTVSSRATLTAADVWAETTKTITGLSDPALTALANAVWNNSTKELTYYGNNITAQDVWDVLTSSLTTIDSIGRLLVTNVDETISSRSSQTILDTLSQNVATTSALIDTSVSSRASQSSLDAHESAQAAFRSSTTSTLGAMTVNVAAVLTQLSSIETKIDTITSTLFVIEGKIDIVDSSLDSVKATVEDTNTKVTAMQTVTNNILTKWGSYDAATLIGYIDTLETNLGDSEDATSSATVFGKLNYIRDSSGSGGTIDLIYAQAQSTHTKLLEVQTELGFNGKSTTAYDDMVVIKGYIDTVEASLATLDTRTSSIATSVTNVSNDLKAVTDRIGKVSVDSFTQLFEVKNTDIDYLKNKVIELKAMADIDRQLLEKTANQPIVKVVMEWGSVIIKFVIVNPSDSATQKIPFKAFLPKEVKQEYIMDLGGLTLNYDATTEQYYVTADITLEKGESVTRNVEIKDIWIISDDEVASLRKQADELSSGLKSSSYFAQGLTLKTDINTRLDKVVRKQKDNNATPQDHILAYRENVEDMDAVNENVKGLKDLVLNSGAGSNFLASVGGIQTFATWGIVLVLIFGMGILGMFYYQLWKRKVVTITAIGKTKRTKGGLSGGSKQVELPTPAPFVLPGLNLAWFRNIIYGWVVLLKDIVGALSRLVKLVTPRGRKAVVTISSLPKNTLMVITIVGMAVITATGGIMVSRRVLKKNLSVNKVDQVQVAGIAIDVGASPNKEEKVEALVAEMEKEATYKKNINGQIEELMRKTEKEASPSTFLEVNGSASSAVSKTQEEGAVLGALAEHQQLVVIKQTPTDWLNVRAKPSISAEVITKVYPGESYPFSEIQSGWYKILLKDLTDGWVAAQYVEPEKEMNKSSDFVEVDPPDGGGVNVREKPDKNSRVIKSVYLKNNYRKLDEDGDWTKIELLDGGTGWVFNEYVTILDN